MLGQTGKTRRVGDGGEVRDAILLLLAVLFALLGAWKWLNTETFKEEAWQRAVAQVNQRKAEPLPLDHLRP